MHTFTKITSMNFPKKCVKNAHIIMYSGGINSYVMTQRILKTINSKDVYCIFADTLMEDEDLYKFLDQSINLLPVHFIYLTQNKNIWDIMFEYKLLGNTMYDPCSYRLKRNYIRMYLNNTFDTKSSIVYIGLNWDEKHRLNRAKKYWGEWKILAPLCNKPYLNKEDFYHQVLQDGLFIPRLYKLGFNHNNCGGFCIKAGQKQFKLLYENFPERYKYHENKEQEIQKYLNKPTWILRKNVNKIKHYISLKCFREQILEKNNAIDEEDYGGYGCFTT